MNYIYDIYLNLNETLYDFYDWNKNDKITHIKKIPIFKTDESILKTIIHNIFSINKDFLSNIHNKTEIWNFNKKIDYCCLFSDGNSIISIEFNKNGKSIKKSFLYVDEELEILETIYKLKEKNIDINILKEETNILKTRNQIKEEKFINKELKNIDENKLNYIYFECFGKKETNKQIILKNINNISKNSKIYKNLYDILKLTSTTKK